jgi:ubiquitin-protein ligase
VLVDAILIGPAASPTLAADMQPLQQLVHATGGFTFVPATPDESTYPFELELVLSSALRVNHRAIMRPSQWVLKATPATSTACSRDVQPPPLVPLADLQRTDNSVSLGKMLNTSPPTGSIDERLLRRLMIELRNIERAPHPQIDVYPCATNLLLWRFVVAVPADTPNSPYCGGTFLGYLRFPTNFPQSPPECRFITPIRHVNTNAYGKVCHSVLNEHWEPTRTILDVLSCVFGLLLSPEVDSPVDTSLAQQLHMSPGVYETVIAQFVLVHAKTKTRAAYARELGEVDADEIVQEPAVSIASAAATRAAETPNVDVADTTDDDDEPLPMLLLACSVCGATADVKKCGGCGIVSYCGLMCQRSHWRQHKAECRAHQAANAAKKPSKKPH